MKARHWINLIVVGLTAGLLTFLAFRWAITSYAEPTCRRFAESQGMTYVGFIPPDWNSNSGNLHLSRDGNCQLRASNGEVQTVGLVTASGHAYGDPLLVSFVLDWEVVFAVTFLGVAFILAIVTRAIMPRRAGS